MNNNTLLVAAWVTKVIPVVRYIILVLLALIAVATIVLVFMQIGQGGNSTNVVTGNADSYYSQNKGRSKQGILKKITIAMASIIAIVIVLFFITIIVENAI